MTSKIKFIHQIQVSRLVHDESLTDDEILKAFQTKLSSKQLRTVLANGIHQLHDTSDNGTKILDPLHKELSKAKKAKQETQESSDDDGKIKHNDLSNNPQNDSNDSFKQRALDKALGMDSIMCKIFSFLNFQCLIQCSLINSNWLANTFQNASIYNLNIGSLYNYKKSLRGIQPWNYFERLNNKGKYTCQDREKKLLLRFRNVLSLTLQRWRAPLTQYFQGLVKFDKLHKLFIVPPIARGITRLDVTTEEYQEIILSIIKNNASDLNTLSIGQIYTETFDSTLLNEIWGLKLFNLQILKLKNIVLADSFITNSVIIAPKLIQLYLYHCKFDMAMFTQCCNLFNRLEILKLDKVAIVRPVMTNQTENTKKNDLSSLNFSKLKQLYFRFDVGERLAFGLFFEMFIILRNRNVSNSHSDKLESLSFDLHPTYLTNDHEHFIKHNSNAYCGLNNLQCLTIGLSKLSRNTFSYQSDFDQNGLLYFLGTRGYTRNWVNPGTRDGDNLVEVTSSGMMDNSEPVTAILQGNHCVRCVTRSMKDAWIVIDLKDIELKVRHYSLKHYSSWDTEALRFWYFEGHNESIRTKSGWKLIKSHIKDTRLDRVGATYTWKVDCVNYYSKFRIRQYGRNSNKHWHLACSGIEFYGTARGGIIDELSENVKKSMKKNENDDNQNENNYKGNVEEAKHEKLQRNINIKTQQLKNVFDLLTNKVTNININENEMQKFSSNLEEISIVKRIEIQESDDYNYNDNKYKIDKTIDINPLSVSLYQLFDHVLTKIEFKQLKYLKIGCDTNPISDPTQFNQTMGIIDKFKSHQTNELFMDLKMLIALQNDEKTMIYKFFEWLNDEKCGIGSANVTVEFILNENNKNDDKADEICNLIQTMFTSKDLSNVEIAVERIKENADQITGVAAIAVHFKSPEPYVPLAHR